MNSISTLRPAVFLDRDGTLIEEVDHLSDIADLRIFDFADAAINLLNSNGYLVIVVTNQSGIGRGYFDQSMMQSIHDQIESDLTGTIDAFYFCPHLPDAGCVCRKPGTGMIDAACRDFAIDLKNSWMVGDKTIDVETGRNARTQSALVLTGYGREHQALLNSKPDVIGDDLLKVVETIVLGGR